MGQDATEEQFRAAVELARSSQMPTLGTSHKLRLYALYKQATEGDAPSAGPSRLRVQEHAKWTAWRSVVGLGTSAAQHVYVQAVAQLCGASGSGADDGLEDDEMAAEVEDQLMSRVGAAVFSMPAQPKPAAPPGGLSVHERAIECAQQGELARLLDLLDEAPDSGAALLQRTDEDGRTLLHWASDSGHVDVARALIARGVSANATDSDGLTALHMAAMCEHETLLALLLARGADRSVADADGELALDGLGEEVRERVLAAAATWPEEDSPVELDPRLAATSPPKQAASASRARSAGERAKPAARVGGWSWSAALASLVAGLVLGRMGLGPAELMGWPPSMPVATTDPGIATGAPPMPPERDDRAGLDLPPGSVESVEGAEDPPGSAAQDEPEPDV